MKCKNCPALKSDGYEYPEYYCAAYPEDDCVDFDDGSEGCYHPLNAIKNRLKPQAYIYYRAHQVDSVKDARDSWVAYDEWDRIIAAAYSKRDCVNLAQKAGYTPNICNDITIKQEDY